MTKEFKRKKLTFGDYIVPRNVLEQFKQDKRKKEERESASTTRETKKFDDDIDEFVDQIIGEHTENVTDIQEMDVNAADEEEVDTLKMMKKIILF